MHLLIWQVTIVVYFTGLAFCRVVGSSPENIADVMQTLKDKEPSDLCPVKNSRIPVYLPHPEDCSQFYVCENRVPYLKKCPNGLHFNIKQKACDYPEHAGCDKDAVVKEKGRIAKQKFDVCPEKNSKFPVYLPDPDDCSRFFICDNGVPHTKKCLSGLHFNPSISACDYPKNAKCDTNADADDKAKGRITDNDVNECPKENSINPVYLPHPDDCSKFYICDNGSPNLKTCLSGLHFNRKLNACDFPENAGCEQDNPTGKIKDKSLGMCGAGDSTYPEYFPHPDDCNKYYICNKGLEILQKCPPGLHFNPKFNVCDFPGNVGCETEMILAAPGVRSPYCPSVDGKIPIFYRHPSNCSVYYMCGNGFAYEFACPDRLHFNLRKRLCDYEENARCKT